MNKSIPDEQKYMTTVQHKETTEGTYCYVVLPFIFKLVSWQDRFFSFVIEGETIPHTKRKN